MKIRRENRKRDKKGDQNVREEQNESYIEQYSLYTAL